MHNIRLMLQARLSERNIVELVTKLQRLQILDEPILHTANGREYLTASHLVDELQEAVLSSRGRCPLVRDPVRWVSACLCMSCALSLFQEHGAHH